MLKALMKNLFAKPIGKAKRKEIYMLCLKKLYEVVEASCSQGLVEEDMCRKKEQLYQIYHEGKEYYIINKDDILAKLVK